MNPFKHFMQTEKHVKTRFVQMWVLHAGHFVCSELNIKTNSNNKNQTYLQPPLQHIIHEIPAVPEKCFLHNVWG